MTVPKERIGDYLRRVRRRLKMKVSTLAYLSGVHHNSISAIERSALLPRPDTLDKLAGPLKVAQDELLHRLYLSRVELVGSQITAEAEGDQDIATTVEEDIEFLYLMSELSPDARREKLRALREEAASYDAGGLASPRGDP